MRENFEFSLEKILEYEGGYVNHPNDKGGPTNKGITLKTLSRFYDETGIGDVDNDNTIDIYDIKNIKYDTVCRIYEKYYWNNLKLDSFPIPIDFMLFDFNVNSGPKNAMRTLQRALNEQGYDIEDDGILGNQTFQSLMNSDIHTLVLDMITKREEFYYRIVENNPPQKIFLKGWLNRISNVKEIALGFLK